MTYPHRNSPDTDRTHEISARTKTEAEKQNNTEMFEIVDDNDRVVGVAPRNKCHGNPELVHRTAHVVVFSSCGKILLQKRSADKDIQPGKWDTAVGGHLAPGETYLQAARREMHEEIGLPEDQQLNILFDNRIRNTVESENVRVFRTVSDGPFNPQSEEIDQLRFWTRGEIRRALGTDTFTPNLETELLQIFPDLRPEP
jgi:isopentenyldiphosphate isomerase